MIKEPNDMDEEQYQNMTQPTRLGEVEAWESPFYDSEEEEIMERQRLSEGSRQMLFAQLDAIKNAAIAKHKGEGDGN